MSHDIVVKFSKPDNMGRVERWIKSRRRIPEDFCLDNRGEIVSDGEWKVGRRLLTHEGHVVTVLTHDLVFMGFSSMVQYSNGAIRQNSYNDFLYEFASPVVQ